jgi:hypothetical protein
MRWKIAVILMLVLPVALLTVHLAHGQTEPTGAATLSAPTEGAALQGLVQIAISSAAPDNQRAELSFAYASDTTNTWFLIWESDQPLEQGELTVWDTTTITDGNYDLRLLVTNSQGEQLRSIVRGLRVRNYTAVETNTPPPAPQQTATPTSTLTPVPTSTTAPAGTPFNTPAADLENPASLRAEQVQQVMLRAGLVVLLLFLLGGLYGLLRGWLRGRA